MKKLKIMILLIIISFSFFLLMYFKKRSYVIKYKADNYNVREEYNKKDGMYYVTINNKYFYIINQKYSHKRNLVTNIKKYKYDDEICFTIKFNDEFVTPSCIKDKEYISHNNVSLKMKNKLGKKYYKTYKRGKKKSYKNININTLFDKKIAIWNYHGFYFLSNDKNKEISLFKNDIYNPSLISSINEYLLIPNYDERVEFSKFKVLNIDNLSIKDFKLNDNISFDSYVLGTNQDSIFIFDTKYKNEYELVPYKEKYRIVNPFIYNKGEKESKTDISLSTRKQTFIYDTTYEYKLIGNKLYRYNKYNTNKMLVTNKEVKEIVKQDNEYVYYLVDDKLYVYSDEFGEILLLDYFELTFNYSNLIYIFD